MGQDTDRQAKLANEILASQKTRSDLLKWKLVICAVLGAAGLGFAKDASRTSIVLLALIPPACLYVDLLCTNINLRIMVIGRYYSEVRKDRYEQFVEKRRISFALEDWALYGSTYVIAILLILSGIAILALRIYRYSGNLADINAVVGLAECMAVLVSAALSIRLTHMTIKAFKLALSHQKFEGEKNIESAFLQELTGSKRLRRVMSCLLGFGLKNEEEG